MEIDSPVRRALLTAFLLRPGQRLGTTEIAELLWDDPPASATANIRTHVTGLRRALEKARAGLGRRLTTYRGGQSGYGLQAGPDETDVSRFALCARQGRNLLLRGDLGPAISTLEAAGALWRGPFGDDLPPTRWFLAHVTGLHNARIDAYQDLCTAYVLARRTEMLSYQLECALAEAPYRQRLWELLAAAHCAEGDAASALSVIQRCQRVFADDLGLDLPPQVEAMRRAALNWDREQALRLVQAHTFTADGAEGVGGAAGPLGAVGIS